MLHSKGFDERRRQDRRPLTWIDCSVRVATSFHVSSFRPRSMKTAPFGAGQQAAATKLIRKPSILIAAVIPPDRKPNLRTEERPAKGNGWTIAEGLDPRLLGRPRRRPDRIMRDATTPLPPPYSVWLRPLCLGRGTCVGALAGWQPLRGGIHAGLVDAVRAGGGGFCAPLFGV